jgi:polyvinyl alcohol dehydrogenase (cytochrome)
MKGTLVRFIWARHILRIQRRKEPQTLSQLSRTVSTLMVPITSFARRRAGYASVFLFSLLLLISSVPSSAAASATTNPGHSPASPAATAAPSGALTGNWVTYHNGNNRTGYSGSLPAVTTPKLNWTATVSGAVYAEPLVYNGRVYLATEGDTVTALDSANGTVSWSTHLGTPASSVTPPYECGGHGPDITPTIGVTGTPVIDASTNTMYVAALINSAGYFLFALNTNTGHVMWNSSITASGFHYLPAEQRGALTLANGLVYVPFGGYSWNCFTPGPIGWVIGMSATGAGAKYSFHPPTSNEADIWSPEGLSVDAAGNVYAVTGDSPVQTFDLGDSVIKLNSTLGWTNSTANYFAPTAWKYNNNNDLDLDNTGATLLPGNLIFSIGKDGVGYLLNSTKLGGIGGQIQASAVCGSVAKGWPYGAWGSTSFYNNVIYVPCPTGLDALALHGGAHPTFTSLWNSTGYWAGPAIIAAGAVWTVSIPAGTLYALNPQTGGVVYQTALSTVEHFTTPAAGDGRIFVAANMTVYAISPTSSSTASSLTVTSQNTNGQTITGYHDALYNSVGVVIASGFTPNTFATTAGLKYSVRVDNYGSCTFAKWSDGVTSNPRPFTATSSPLAFAAVYNCGTTASSVAVSSTDQNGNPISGYYVALLQGGTVVASGFTPKTFSTTSGQTYGVQVDNYGGCTFTKWSDGVTSNPRTFTAGGGQTSFVAVYNCGGPTSSTITVTTVNGQGSTITGYYVTLWQNGAVIKSCFSTCTFTVNNGQTYQVGAASYGSETFNHWKNDGATGLETVVVPSTTTAISLSAVYSP